MPTYTYRCANCEHHFDLVQGFNDPDPLKCPACGFDNHLKRVYKPVGVVFKGSGFYATDNKSSKKSSVLSNNGSKPSENGAENKQPDKKEKTNTESTEKSSAPQKKD